MNVKESVFKVAASKLLNDFSEEVHKQIIFWNDGICKDGELQKDLIINMTKSYEELSQVDRDRIKLISRNLIEVLVDSIDDVKTAFNSNTECDKQYNIGE